MNTALCQVLRVGGEDTEISVVLVKGFVLSRRSQLASYNYLPISVSLSNSLTLNMRPNSFTDLTSAECTIGAGRSREQEEEKAGP